LGELKNNLEKNPDNNTKEENTMNEVMINKNPRT
jgi:hypothetical protein